MLARAAIIGLALLCGAWFALSAHQAHGVAQALAVLSSGRALSPQQVHHAEDALRSAGTLNPDLEVDVLRGELAIAQGHFGHARRILFRVIRQEPKFLAAWQLYARASVHNRVAFFAAQIGIRRLVRVFPPGH